MGTYTTCVVFLFVCTAYPAIWAVFFFGFFFLDSTFFLLLLLYVCCWGVFGYGVCFDLWVVGEAGMYFVMLGADIR